MRQDALYLAQAVCVGLQSKDVLRDRRVGAIIVRHGEVVGTGFRETVVLQNKPYKDITFHAEHRAILDADHKALGATLYCLLEPCTRRSYLKDAWEPPPPCCELIVKAGIARVVYVISDSDFGEGGRKYLEANGVVVEMVAAEDVIRQLKDGTELTDHHIAELTTHRTYREIQ